MSRPSSADFPSGSETLPSGWTMTTGEHLFQVVRGVTYNKNDASDSAGSGKIPILRAGNIQDSRLHHDDLVYVPNECVSPQQILRSGDLVVAMSSGSKLIVGKVGYVDRIELPISFGAFCAAIRPRFSESADWLRWFFRTPTYRGYISEKSAGVNINNLKPAHLLELRIPLPPLSEQRRIVARLESLEARSRRAREKLAAVPAQLAQARQSLLAAAFQSAASSDSAEVRPLESLTQPDRSICYGVVQLGDETTRGVPCIRTSDLKPLVLLTDSPKRIHESVSSNYPRTILRGSEVLVSVRGTLGGIAVAPVSVRGWNISREVAMIALRELALPQFIAMAIAAPQSQAWLTSAIKGVAYSGINIKDLKRLPIPLPMLPKQGEIVRRLTAAMAKLDAAATAHAAAVADIDRLDQALLAHAFTGRLVSPS